MSNEKPSSIRLWLARYKPDRVRCTLRDASQREIPKPTTSRGQWAQLEHAIVAIGPTYLEAFRGEECVSARALEAEEDDASASAPVEEATNPLAALVSVLPTIVQLIVDAADASAARHQAAYELAFARQNELIKYVSDRLGGVERAWMKTIMDRAAQPADDGNDGAAFGLIGQLVAQGRANGAPVPPKADE